MPPEVLIPAPSGETSLTLPASALVREGDKASAWRVKGDKLQKVEIGLGDRDARTGNFIVTRGLADGDRVIRYPSSSLKDGQTVQASAPAKSSTADTTGTRR